MADPAFGEHPTEHTEAIEWEKMSRKEKRRILKKRKRKKARTQAAIREREEDARLNALEEQLPLRLQEEAEQAERNRREFEERERVWIEEAAARKAREEEEQHRKKILEVEERKIHEVDDEYECVEEGPPEIIWQGNEIIIKKGRVKIARGNAEQYPDKKDDNRPTSNPFPPPSATFASSTQGEPGTMQEMLDTVAQQVPNFGTEQDKAHCPFHLKTGACRFGSRCSRVHFYPEKSCTLLIKNMYNGPGLTCEQDEGLEYTDEEIERCYEEFYEDVHTEFLKFGEIVNFKVCKNTSYHLRGNVYVHYNSLQSAITAYNTMNARYYAGKQIACEFAGITKWKIAICGEFMKSRLKQICSHGSACNFIHCFRNPGGDYEWADWDNPPPRYWIKKMVVLFGTSLESSYGNDLESDDYHRHKTRKSRNYRHQSERSSYNEIDWNRNGSSDGYEELNPQKHQFIRYSVTGGHYSKRRGRHVSDYNDDAEETTSRRHQRADVNNRLTLCRHERGRESEERSPRRRKVYSQEPENSGSEDRSSSRRKRKAYSNEKENSECEGISSSRRKRKVYSEEFENSESEVISSSKRKRRIYSDENENSESEDRWSGRRMKTVHSDENENFESEGRSNSRRNINVHTEEKENSRYKGSSKLHEKQEKIRESDRCLDLDRWDSTNGHSLNQFDEKYSFSEDIDSEKDFCGLRYSYSSQSDRRRRN